jgi:hypothetical protein
MITTMAARGVRRGRLAVAAGFLAAVLVPALRGQAVPAPSSPEETVRAFFAAGSGEAGSQPVDRLPDLFVPQGTLITVNVSEPSAQALVRTPEEYVASAKAYLATATQYETPVRMFVEQYGNVGNVFFSFEARRTPHGEPFYRGVASFQLLRDGMRWRIVTAYWQGERPGVPLPARYVK